MTSILSIFSAGICRKSVPPNVKSPEYEVVPDPFNPYEFPLLKFALLTPRIPGLKLCIFILLLMAFPSSIIATPKALFNSKTPRLLVVGAKVERSDMFCTF
ncbi:hypothetical protein D9M68_741210 [compost metagenome]